MKKATVIIPNYNGIVYMDNCLQALQKSTMQADVIVVDNGSTDGSLEQTKENYPQIKMIAFQENTGFCRAVNAGIQAAQSEYVILLNNDTEVEPDFIERLVEAIEELPGAFSVSALLKNMKQPSLVDDAGDFYCALGWAYARGKDKPVEKYVKRCRIFSACGGAVIYRRALFEEIGYFDENHFAYLEDIDIGYRALIHGYENYFEPGAGVLHAGSGVSGSRHNEFKVKLSSRNSVYLVYKNMPFFQIIINSPFLLLGFFVKTLFFIRKGLGRTYLNGLREGVALCNSPEGRKKKNVFYLKNMGHYIKIQWYLWVNILRRFAG